jgi:hypothetical protein
MSGGVCGPRYEMEHRATARHIFCVKLGDSDTITHRKLQQAFGDDATSRAHSLSLAQYVLKRQNPY